MTIALMIPTFHSVAPVYPVEDVGAAVVWYRTLLGFETVYVNRDPDDGDPTNYALIRRDHVTLHLMRRSEAAEGFGGRADAQFCIRGNLDSLFATLKANGATVLQSPQDQPWGCRDFAIADPSGNRIWVSTVLSPSVR